MPITRESMIVRSPDIVFANIEDEVVMMSLESSAYLGLDDIGSRIWAGIETPTRVENLCRDLMRRYEIGLEQCLDDVISFLTELEASKAIQLVVECETEY
ncbi:MAG: PqqD family peptide modification chaperone [Exilibacterium sp.]